MCFLKKFIAELLVSFIDCFYSKQTVFYVFLFNFYFHWKIYTICSGCIMNAMVEELICRVTSVEDIHVDVATELITLYNVVVRRAPAIFPVNFISFLIEK